MKDKIAFNARYWDKAEVGICNDDLENEIKAEQGNWLEVKYDNKTVSAKIRGLDRRDNWPKDKMIFIGDGLRKELGFPSISGHDATKPSTVNLTVWKRWFPPFKKMWPVYAVFVLLLVGIIFTTLNELELFPQFKMEIGAVLFALAVIGAGLQAYSLGKQLQ